MASIRSRPEAKVRKRTFALELWQAGMWPVELLWFQCATRLWCCQLSIWALATLCLAGASHSYRSVEILLLLSAKRGTFGEVVRNSRLAKTEVFGQPQDACNGLSVLNCFRPDHLQRLRERHQFPRNKFVGFGVRWTGCQASGKINRHGLVHKARAGIEEQGARPLPRAIACLLQQFTLGARQRLLARIEAPRG